MKESVSATAEHILRAVVHHIHWAQGRLIPEAVVNYNTGRKSQWGDYEIRADYLADLMWVTAAGYATEFEIKISRSDWRADNSKGKWGHMPTWISRFIYVVPEDLGIPDFVNPCAGVWHYYRRPQWRRYQVKVVRAPSRIGKEKVPQKIIDRWMYHAYCRYWHIRLANNVPNLIAEREAA